MVYVANPTKTVSGYCAIMYGENTNNNTEMFENLIKHLIFFRVSPFSSVFHHFHKWNKTLRCQQVKVK